MKVKTTHPITGKTKIIEMTADEYRANKILNPGIRIIEDETETIKSGQAATRKQQNLYSYGKVLHR